MNTDSGAAILMRLKLAWANTLSARLLGRDAAHAHRLFDGVMSGKRLVLLRCDHRRWRTWAARGQSLSGAI